MTCVALCDSPCTKWVAHFAPSNIFQLHPDPTVFLTCVYHCQTWQLETTHEYFCFKKKDFEFWVNRFKCDDVLHWVRNVSISAIGFSLPYYRVMQITDVNVSCGLGRKILPRSIFEIEIKKRLAGFCEHPVSSSQSRLAHLHRACHVINSTIQITGVIFWCKLLCNEPRQIFLF